MGAFVLVTHADGDERERTVSADGKAADEMRRRGLQQSKVFETCAFTLRIYRRRRFETADYLEFQDGDFVVAIGTFLYSGKYGEEALAGLYEDLKKDRFSFEKSAGHFGVVARVEGRLLVFSDYCGMCQLYANDDKSVISTSFLAVYATLDSYTPNTQEIYEFLALTAFYGNRTLLEEIDRLDRRRVHERLPQPKSHEKQIRLPELYDGGDFDRHLQQAHRFLREHFSRLVAVFGDGISIGLTGGFDSRLVLAHLRAAGCHPRVYVQGTTSDIDVKVARSIAAIAGFDIEHEELHVEFPKDELTRRLVEGSRYVDGVSHMGLFDKWPLSADTRIRRPRPELLRLYGMGGEIFRRKQEIPDRMCSIPEALSVHLDKFDASAFSDRFSRNKLFAGIGDKIIDELALSGGMLSPVDAERVYPEFRLRSGAGSQLTNENERAHALVPYMEPVFVEISRRIPMRYRDFGDLNARLIECADPQLAAAPSAYGHPFTARMPVKNRLRRKLVRWIPLSLRPVMHRARRRLLAKPGFPFYLEPDFLCEVFPDGVSHVSEYVDLGRVRDAGLLSRALTVELLLDGRLSSEASGP